MCVIGRLKENRNIYGSSSAWGNRACNIDIFSMLFLLRKQKIVYLQKKRFKSRRNITCQRIYMRSKVNRYKNVRGNILLLNHIGKRESYIQELKLCRRYITSTYNNTIYTL